MAHWVELLIQVVAAAGLGAAIGFERELSAQPAGLRTHMLVSLGAALFSIAGSDLLGGDPTRVAAQVVTGIGFLGGGAILREGMSIRGLTTAASLWVSAALGLAIGLHAYLAAVSTMVLALIVLAAIKKVEDEYLPQRRQLEVTLSLEPETTLSTVEHAVADALPRSRVLRVQYREGGQELVVMARPQLDLSLAALAERLLSLPGVHGVDINR
ncbi:MAG: MgtC/SapB family protein [Micromonosporaceae bacterium]